MSHTSRRGLRKVIRFVRDSDLQQRQRVKLNSTSTKHERQQRVRDRDAREEMRDPEREATQ